MRIFKTIGQGAVVLVEGINAKAQDKVNNELNQTRLHTAQVLVKSPATDTGSQVYEVFALTAKRHVLVSAHGLEGDNRGFEGVTLSSLARDVL